MRQISFSLLAVIFLLACNNTETKVSPAIDSAATTTSENISMPYTMEKTPDWVPGDLNHVALAMETLKAYETNDSASLAKNLADSVEFYHDNLSLKGTRDSIVNFITAYRNTLQNVTIKMRDYESVKSNNRGEEWVSLWYTETTTGKSGKVDSMMVMDDIRIVNNKIAVIDSKMRKLPKSK